MLLTRGRWIERVASAVEGVWTDYIMATPFATDFKFARFDARAPIAPRAVGSLAGAKSNATSDGLSAGTVELHGVDATI